MAVPLVILVGIVAGLSIVRRAWKATGIERDQLRWRAFTSDPQCRRWRPPGSAGS